MQKLALVGLGASGLFALQELAGADVEVLCFRCGSSLRKSDMPALSTGAYSPFVRPRHVAIAPRAVGWRWVISKSFFQRHP